MISAATMLYENTIRNFCKFIINLFLKEGIGKNSGLKKKTARKNVKLEKMLHVILTPLEICVMKNKLETNFGKFDTLPDTYKIKMSK